MSDSSPLVLIMAGGTGGHIFPGLATARGLMAKGVRVHWLGTPGSMESELVPQHGIDISTIPVTGLRGKGIGFLLKAPWRLLVSLFRAIRIIRQLKPVCVVGMGGYVTGPGGLAARMLGLPLLVHEQNAVAGLTNRLLARMADRVLEAFPDTFPAALSSKVRLTGNPVRAEISAVPDPSPHGPLRLLVVGGSRGALAINQLLPDVLKACGHQVSVWHQTGKVDFEACRERYQSLGVQGKIEPFIDDMAEAYQWADLVLCRSGALTVAELAASGRPAILVPYPHAVDDHQTVNGQYLVSRGAAMIIQQNQLDVDGLTNRILQLADDASKLERMASAARSAGLSGATGDVVNHCLEVSGLEVSHA